MTFTAAQRDAILAETRRSFADSPHKPRFVMKSIEADIATNQSEIAALRADFTALSAQVETLARMIAGLAQDVSEFRSFAKGMPQPGAQWWQWVDERIAGAIGELSNDTEQAVGHIADTARVELDALSGATELLKRELSVLKNEVAVTNELQDLRNRIGAAQKTVPQIPTIIAGMRDEAARAKVETDRQLAELRKQAKADRHAVAALKVEQGVAASALKRSLNQELEVQWEATSRSARMVVRPSIHPDAMKTLREFAAKVIDGSVIQH